MFTIFDLPLKSYRTVDVPTQMTFITDMDLYSTQKISFVFSQKLRHLKCEKGKRRPGTKNDRSRVQNQNAYLLYIHGN